MRTPMLLLIAAALIGLCYSIATVGITMITRDAFGLANYGKTYPIVNLVGNMSNAVFSSVVGFMYDFTGGYTLTLFVFLAMVASIFAIVLFVYGHTPEKA
jgi:MFS family permease